MFIRSLVFLLGALGLLWVLAAKSGSVDSSAVTAASSGPAEAASRVSGLTYVRIHDDLWLGKTEVTVDAYRACVEARKQNPLVGCDPPSVTITGEDDAATGLSANCNAASRSGGLPMNCLSYAQAGQFCAWDDRSFVPTAAQWWMAAVSESGAPYPWGDDSRPDYANVCQPGSATQSDLCLPPDHATTTVGKYSAGASPEGVLDMIGNVAEWVSTAPRELPVDCKVNDRSDCDRWRTWRLVLGGSYQWPLEGIDGPSRAYPRSDRHSTVGFRCARLSLPRTRD